MGSGDGDADNIAHKNARVARRRVTASRRSLERGVASNVSISRTRRSSVRAALYAHARTFPHCLFALRRVAVFVVVVRWVFNIARRAIFTRSRCTPRLRVFTIFCDLALFCYFRRTLRTLGDDCLASVASRISTA